MSLMKEGLWGIVAGTEAVHRESEAAAHSKYVGRHDKALAIVVLSVDPTLYLIGEPTDPKAACVDQAC